MSTNKLLIALTLALTLTGCSLIPDAISAGTKANNKAVDTAKFTLCRGASIGAMRRNFNDTEMYDLWRILNCD